MKPLHLARRKFGNTPLHVSPLGFGAGHIGGHLITEDEAGTLLNRAVDMGINAIDTARGYGMSEERIGRHLSYRRKDFVLVSKCGYSVPGFQDWSPECIQAGVEMALRMMRTDYIDVMLFHSCPRTTLEQDGVIAALEAMVNSGKVLAMGYSGENEDMSYALSTGKFSVIETSVNIADQRGIATTLAEARQRSIGVIAKRPIANAAWKYAERPTGQYAEVYWERIKAMNLQTLVEQSGLTWTEIALRFTLFTEGVHTAIVGTGNIANLHKNIDIANKGALPDDLVEILHAVFAKNDENWEGQI